MQMGQHGFQGGAAVHAKLCKLQKHRYPARRARTPDTALASQVLNQVRGACSSLGLSPCLLVSRLHLCPHDVRVDLGDAVDSVGAHNAEVCHVDPLDPPFLDQGHSPQAVDVLGEQRRDPLRGRETRQALGGSSRLGVTIQRPASITMPGDVPLPGKRLAPVSIQVWQRRSDHRGPGRVSPGFNTPHCHRLPVKPWTCCLRQVLQKLGA